MKAWKYVLLLIAFIPLLYFRDFTPNNELKYLSIADEAIQNKTFLTFYNHEQIYADKPPLYFWIIMAGKSLLGFHSMLFISLFSLLPALLILYILNRWLSPYTDKKNLQTCNLMLITSGLFMGSAMVLRMDMLMCLFILLALHTFYKIYIGQASPRDKTLLPVYIFMALFTKGPCRFIAASGFHIGLFTFTKKNRHIRTLSGLETMGYIMYAMSDLVFRGIRRRRKNLFE